MNIRTNIQICNGVVVASILFTATLLFFINKHIEIVHNLNIKKSELENITNEFRAQANTLGQNLHFYLVSADPTFKEQYKEGLDNFTGKIARPATSVVAPSQSISVIDILMQFAEDSSEKRIIEELRSFMQQHIKLDEEIISRFDEQGRGSELQHNTQALEAITLFFYQTNYLEYAIIPQSMNTFIKSVQNRIDVQLHEIETLLTLETIFAVLGMMSILVSNLFSQFIINKRILVPLTETTNYANAAANGDDSARIRIAGDDEISVLRKAIVAFVRSMQSNANMQKLVSELEETMNSLSRIAFQLEDSMFSSAQSSEEQTISIIETVTAMEEMNATVREVSKSADVAATLSVQTKTQAEDGEQSVQKLISSINSVNEKSLNVKADIATLLSHANNISSIMNVISDIADQTNLLALNAAIEAARAGDAGRGFAVVADEVRKLAEKTMASTTGVASAIHAIQSSVESNRKQVDTTVEDVEIATKLAEECGTSLHEIVVIAEESADKVMTITSASKKQSKTSEDIARAVSHVNDIAANTSTVINEVSETIKTLISEKNMLSDLINELKIDMTPGARKELEKEKQKVSLTKIDAKQAAMTQSFDQSLTAEIDAKLASSFDTASITSTEKDVKESIPTFSPDTTNSLLDTAENVTSLDSSLSTEK